MINVKKDQLIIIKQILHKYVPECEVRVFGSRITKNIKNYSDLDLVIVGKSKIPNKSMIYLKEAFEESTLPFRVDVLDWHKISDNFKKIILKNHKKLPQLN